jgi:hypothetical protein
MKTLLLISLLLFVGFGLGSVEAQSCYMPAGMQDDDNSCLGYSGLYTTHHTGVTGFHLETYTETYGVYFDYEGAGFVIYGRKHPLSPPISICIYSDVFPEFYYCENNVSTYSPVDEITELYRFEGITGYGEWHADAFPNPFEEGMSNYFDLDAIEILDAPSAEPPPSPTNTPDPTIFYYDVETSEGSQTVAFQYFMTAGDVAVSMGLYALLVLGTAALVVTLWHK